MMNSVEAFPEGDRKWTRPPAFFTNSDDRFASRCAVRRTLPPGNRLCHIGFKGLFLEKMSGPCVSIMRSIVLTLAAKRIRVGSDPNCNNT